MGGETAVDKCLAQQASFNSIKYVKAKNKEAWLDLFAEDAVVEDPVGVSPLDPSGLGHKGREAIAAFWDLAIAIGDIEFELKESHPCGYECANSAKLTKKLSEDIAIVTDLVIVYRVNDDGKVCSLKAYWEYEKVQQQLDKAFS
jgi:ketosteroid isomerase-like protein